MRALGPGSVSSLLKIVVEVIYVALWVVLALQLIGVAALLIFQPFAINLLRVDPDTLRFAGTEHVSGSPLTVAGLLFVAAVYVAVLVLVFNRLRRVFATLTQGDPFHPDNVARLRVIGLGLIGLEAIGYGLRMALAFATHGLEPKGATLNATGWFAILVVFVLAEVFREGARLRQEAELTI